MKDMDFKEREEPNATHTFRIYSAKYKTEKHISYTSSIMWGQIAYIFVPNYMPKLFHDT